MCSCAVKIMSKRVPPPPSDAAPVSSEVVVEIVKKRLAAPRDPPPSGLTGFKPKSIAGPGRMDFDDDKSEPKNTGSRDRYEIEDEDQPRQYRDTKSSNSHSPPRGSLDDRYLDNNSSYDRDRDQDRDRRGYNGNMRGSGEAERRDWSHTSSSATGARDDPRDRPNFAADPKYQKYMQEQQQQAQAKQSKASGGGDDGFYGGGGGGGGGEGQQPRPHRLIPFDFGPVLNSTYRDLREFVMSPIEPGVVVRCYIERNRSGMNMLFPVFTLCADLEDGTGRELMACRKVAQSMTSHYVFSLKNEDLYRPREQRSRLYLGKLRHISATEYVLFDDGICKPNSRNSEDAVDEEEDDDETTMQSEAKSQAKSTGGRDTNATAATANNNNGGGPGGAAAAHENTLYRKELAVVCFNTQTRPVAINIRGCEVGIPAVPTGFAATTEESAVHFGRNHTGIITSFRKARQAGLQNAAHYRKCFIMHEKASKYDPLSSCLVDFKGRANIASVKNFQLIRSGFQVRKYDCMS